MGLDSLGRIHPGNINAVIFHHVAGAVVPRPQEGAEMGDGGFKVAGDRVREIHERPRAGLDVEHRQLGADRHRLGVDARIQLAAKLGFQFGAQLSGAVLRNKLVVRAVD